VRPSALRPLLLAAGLLAAAAGTPAQEPGEKFKVLDLVFRVVDTGGKVQDLQMKETKTEVRIDLAADVLFDFDKADIKPAASDSLSSPAAPSAISSITQGSEHSIARRSPAVSRKAFISDSACRQDGGPSRTSR